MAFRKAKAEQAALKVGVYGPAGSGKTLTSLLMAEGLATATGKRIAFVDTERGTDFYCKLVPERKVHPEPFDFDAVYTRSLADTLKECQQIDPAQHGVIVIDSITHLWEAAKLAYNGRTVGNGNIPLNAWTKIKAPYKALMSFLLSTPIHVIFCGRQGNEMAENEDGEMKTIGVKMKAEGETQYEPHILLRMEPEKDKKGNSTIKVFAEKDRTGILSGKTITLWPGSADTTFKTLVAPILPLLGDTQAKVETDDEIAQHDGEAQDRDEREKSRESADMFRQFTGKFQSANTKEELKAAGAALTAAIKKKMLPAHVTQLRNAYRDAELRVNGEHTTTTAAAEEVAA